MKAPRHNAEEYRIICIILVVIIVFMGWFWYQSEENMLKLLDEFREKEYEIEVLKGELYEYRGY